MERNVIGKHLKAEPFYRENPPIRDWLKVSPNCSHHHRHSVYCWILCLCGSQLVLNGTPVKTSIFSLSIFPVVVLTLNNLKQLDLAKELEGSELRMSQFKENYANTTIRLYAKRC